MSYVSSNLRDNGSDMLHEEAADDIERLEKIEAELREEVARLTAALATAQPAPATPAVAQSFEAKALEVADEIYDKHRGWMNTSAGQRLIESTLLAVMQWAASQRELSDEPVAQWQVRAYRDGCGGEPVGWGKWETVEPRNIHTDTVKDMVAEICAYIEQGYRYELRALYTRPELTKGPL